MSGRPAAPSLEELDRRLRLSRDRLRRRHERRLAAMSLGVSRMRSAVDAARLMAQLAQLEADRTVAGGSSYLAAARALSTLEHDLAGTEVRLTHEARQARGELEAALALLGEIAPELLPAARRLVLDLPLDTGMARRLRALIALIEARRDIVPRLAAARPTWKR